LHSFEAGAVNAEEYVKLREDRAATVKRVSARERNVTCPNHDDDEPSLSVTAGHDGCVLLYCHGGCATADVLAADGLTWGDLFPTQREGEVVDVYQYVDEQGKPLFEQVRFDPKGFKLRRPNGEWGIRGVRRVLYRLPQVNAAVQAGVTVYVVAGEKDVHAIERAGGVATTNPMGEGKNKWRRDYTECLRGALVILVGDKDAAGREHARTVAKALQGVVASLAVVEAGVGKDAHDHLAAGKALDEFVPLDLGDSDTQDDESDSSEAFSTLHVLDVEKMLTTPPPPVPWVVEPILVQGCVTMLAGREGQGKSMVALAVAAGVGRATFLLDIAGMRVGLGGHVLYVDAENGEHEAHRRVHGLSVEAGTLTYVEADGFDLRQNLGELERVARECQPRVLVLDSLRSLAPGLDENDSQQAEAALRPVVGLTRQLDIATLILHHASRQSGEYRGSTAIGAAVQLGFTLSRIDDDPMARSRRKLTCWKLRPAEEPEPRWLTIKPDGDGGIVLRHAEAYKPPSKAPVRNDIEEALITLITGGVGCGDTTLPLTPHPPERMFVEHG
jgi:hypothetical protein